MNGYKKGAGLKLMKDQGYNYLVSVVTLDESQVIHGVAIQGDEVTNEDFRRIEEAMRTSPELSHLHHLRMFIDYKFQVTHIDLMIEAAELS
jgi:hypothetical protein